MSRREMRRRPVAPPRGFHWEVTRSAFEHGGVPCFADFWLVEDGRRIDAQGFYEPATKGAERPMPTFRAVVGKEHQVRTETRREVQRFDAERQTQVRIARLRAEYRP